MHKTRSWPHDCGRPPKTANGKKQRSSAHTRPKQEGRPYGRPSCFGGESGIRTHGPLRDHRFSRLSPKSDINAKYFDDTNYKLRGKERARFKELLEDLLSAVPDTLTVDEVAELTGYHRRTILRYVQRKYIYGVNIMGKYYISKQSIINYLATDKAFKNTQKSEWHVSTIKIFYKRESFIS